MPLEVDNAPVGARKVGCAAPLLVEFGTVATDVPARPVASFITGPFDERRAWVKIQPLTCMLGNILRSYIYKKTISDIHAW